LVVRTHGPNEEVVSSIPHADVVLTTIVHPTMMGGLWTLLYGYLKVLWGDTMSGIFKALVAS
jgi:Na+-transporting NADH:ubiquinone oxidoreductase subunit NqrC